MPFSAPIIAALIGAAATGTTTGLQLAGSFSPSTSAQTDALKKQQEDAAAQQQKQQQLSQQEAFKHFAPDAQAQTGGALSDSAFSALVAELSGQPGNIQQAQQTIFGSGQNPSEQPLSTQQPGLATLPA